MEAIVVEPRSSSSPQALKEISYQLMKTIQF